MAAELHAALTQLSPEARLVLERICAAHAALPFPAETAGRLRPDYLCRAEQELALQELRRAGMLELRRKLWGDTLYQIPQQHLAQIQRLFGPPAQQPLNEAAVRLEYPACTGLAAELFKALLFTAREGLPLTAKGVIHKKQLGRLAGQLALREEHLSGLLLLQSGPEQYPLPVMVIVDLMAVLGLISREPGAYQPDPVRLQQWLAKPEPEMTDLLYRIVISRYSCSEPAVQHFRHLIAGAEFPPGQWFAAAPVLDWMSGRGLAPGQQEDAAAGSGLNGAVQAWLSCLAGFGWCDLGYTAEGEACFRWKAGKPQMEAERAAAEWNAGSGGPPEADPAAGFIVQPDFEVLVPPDVPFSIRWRLAAYAELLHNEDLWSFRLTRELLETAAEQGSPPEQSIAWLAAHTTGGLPEQVELALRQWARGIGRTALSEVILLSCAGEADGEAIAAHPRLQDILTRIGPLHFLVRPDGIQQLRKELAASGMNPQMLSGGREEADRPACWSEAPGLPEAADIPYRLPDKAEERGLLGKGAPPQLLPPGTGAEEQGRQLPGEEAVPQMWMNQWRQYHATTAQKVMEQALAWGIKVRISRQGQQADFIPEQLSGRPWSVRGIMLLPGAEAGEEIQLAAGDWQEMQLLSPLKYGNSSSAEAGGYVMIR